MDYDVIVIGGGHAGIEAASAASRLGKNTLLVTQNLDTVGKLSCNPAVGGLAKGNIVREIDALGGEMAKLIDQSMIQFRILNQTRGPAVQAPRAQADKFLYSAAAKQTLERQPRLTLFQDTVVGFLINRSGCRVEGIVTERGHRLSAAAVVMTTGTFMEGKIFIGDYEAESGRLGEPAAKGLGKHLRELGFTVGRLKTGTPARILGASINFSACEEQKGDEKPVFFAFYDTRDQEKLFHEEQSGTRLPGWMPGTKKLSCWITSTGPNTGTLVKENISFSPLYSGLIHGTGARYCPSIEDKFVKFPDKDAHRLFLEPESLFSDEWYVNGFSTSLPFSVQLEMIRSVPALENAVMLRPAYAIEYDYAPPTQLFSTLETKKVENLFFAGQINGTSGYEEAGIQGLVAGANAAAKVLGLSPVVIGRSEGYGGVLIDDLVTKGTQEPYRMFTSRAEYRLLFNHGSAELRLINKIESAGLLDDARIRKIRKKAAAVEHWCEMFEKLTVRGGIIGDVLRRDASSVPEGLPFIACAIAAIWSAR